MKFPAIAHTSTMSFPNPLVHKPCACQPSPLPYYTQEETSVDLNMVLGAFPTPITPCYYQ